MAEAGIVGGCICGGGWYEVSIGGGGGGGGEYAGGAEYCGGWGFGWTYAGAMFVAPPQPVQNLELGFNWEPQCWQ